MGKPIDIDSLTRDERLDLLERVWASLSPEDIPVKEAQRAELDRRSDALQQDLASGREVGIPWEEVTRQLRARR